MPNKPAKYGIKVWVACDAKSSYAWNMQVYMGKLPRGIPEKNQGMRVVLDLTVGLREHNVTCHNFFTFYELDHQLLKRKMTMVGTVRKNKPELPHALLSIRGRAVFSSKFAFTPTTTLVSYLPKRNKNVSLLSPLHKTAEISDREDRKPDIILDYNCNKGGVDNLDKVIGMYNCRRMTALCPLVIFHNIIDVSSYNNFMIWQEINPGCQGRKTREACPLSTWERLLSPLALREGSVCPTQKPLQPLWKLFRELNLILSHRRLQLGQSKEKGASSAPERRTARHKLCSAHVGNTSAKPILMFANTVLHVLNRVDVKKFLQHQAFVVLL